MAIVLQKPLKSRLSKLKALLSSTAAMHFSYILSFSANIGLIILAREYVEATVAGMILFLVVFMSAAFSLFWFPRNKDIGEKLEETAKNHNEIILNASAIRGNPTLSYDGDDGFLKFVNSVKWKKERRL